MTLPEYITSYMNKPFVWGEHDCVSFAVGWLEIKHEQDYLSKYKPWATAKQALRIVKSYGGLESLFDQRLEKIHPNLARDGDICLYKGRACLFSGSHIVGPGHNGLVYLDRMLACSAWRS